MTLQRPSFRTQRCYVRKQKAARWAHLAQDGSQADHRRCDRIVDVEDKEGERDNILLETARHM